MAKQNDTRQLHRVFAIILLIACVFTLAFPIADVFAIATQDDAVCCSEHSGESDLHLDAHACYISVCCERSAVCQFCLLAYNTMIAEPLFASDGQRQCSSVCSSIFKPPKM